MSIPWRGGPPQHVVELTTTAAAFFAPLALVFLSKKIASVLRKIRQRAHAPPCTDVLYDSGVCHIFPEGRDKVPKKDQLVQQDIFPELDVNQNEDQEDLRADHQVVQQESLYCVCGTLVDSTSLSKEQPDDGERGDCGEFALMEPPYSDMCLRENALLSETLGEQKRSLDALKSDTSSRDPSKSRDYARGHQARDMDSRQAEEDYRTMIDDLKHSLNEPAVHSRCESNPPGESTETGLHVDPSKPADTSVDEALQELEKVTEGSASPRNHVNSPRNQALSTRYCTSADEASDNSDVEEVNIQESLTEEREDSGLGISVSVSGDNSKEVVDDEECSRGVTEVCAQEESECPVEASQQPAQDFGVASGLTPIQEDPQTNDAASENQLGAVQESAAEPHDALSRSSSCDSFSTANCSSRASAVRLSVDFAEESEQEEDCYQTPRVENRDRPGHRRKSRDRHDGKARPLQGRELSDHLSVETMPIFKLVTPPPPPPPLTSSQEKLRVQQSQRGSQENQDDPETEDSEPDSETSSGSHSGHSSQTEEEKETQHFTQWFSKALKSWLPAFKKNQEMNRNQPQLSKQRSSDQFELFDVRNVLGGDHQQPNMAMSDAKACPHSCVSSLCNFRRTLESWKKQLLAMHAALDASSAALSDKPCIYCHEDQPSGSHHQCHTMQIAQVFWRTVLQFKRSHLESSDCPHVRKHGSGTKQGTSVGFKDPKAVDSEECALGHRHSCNSDYSGCSQQPSPPVSETNMNEAPCVHVLLDDVDMLLRRLENIKESNSLDKSKKGQGSTRSKPAEKVSDAEGNAEDQRLCSDEKSTGSIISPSPSISLPDELGDLEEIADSILESCDQSTDDACSDKENEPAREKSEGGHVKTPAVQRKRSQKDPSLLAEMTAIKESPAKEEDPPPSSASGESLTRLRELCRSAEQAAAEGSRPVSRSEQLMISKTKVLGKFALRYLEHIEQKLDSDTQILRVPSPERASSRPASGGDTPRPLPRTLLRGRPGAQALSEENAAAALQQKLSDALMSKFPESSFEASQDTQTRDPEGSRDGASVTGGGSKDVEREPSLVSAFREIIADLDKLHAGKPVARHKASSKNVKFALPCVQRSRSLTSASPTTRTSSPLHQTAQGSSSCLSLTTSGENLHHKDLSVTEAFDQLDKVVDDLLQLMNVEEPR